MVENIVVEIIPQPGLPLWFLLSSDQSEGFPRTGYFIPAHVGAGAGQVWRILPPAPYKGRKSQDISYLDGPDMGYLSGTKSL